MLIIRDGIKLLGLPELLYDHRNRQYRCAAQVDLIVTTSSTAQLIQKRRSIQSLLICIARAPQGYIRRPSRSRLGKQKKWTKEMAKGVTVVIAMHLG